MPQARRWSARPRSARFLKWRRGLPAERLKVIDPKAFGTLSLPGFKLSAFRWKHRDINLPRALSRARVPRQRHAALLGVEQRHPRAVLCALYRLPCRAARWPHGHELQRGLQHQDDRCRDRRSRPAPSHRRAAGRHAAQLHGRRGARRGRAEAEGPGALPAARKVPRHDGGGLGAVACLRRRGAQPLSRRRCPPRPAGLRARRSSSGPSS